MRNITACKLALILEMLLFIPNPSIAQNTQKLRIGFFLGYGKDHYSRKLKGLAKAPGFVERFDSKNSVQLGAYGEKQLRAWLFAVPRAYFSSQNVPTNTLCNCSHLDYLQKERHYIVSLGLGLRGYIPSKSATKAFLGIGLSTDYFLGYTEKRNDKASFHLNAQGYNRFNPIASAELGLQWKRIGLSAEYGRNLGSTFSKGYQLSSGDRVKRSIFRQEFLLKVSFMITAPPPN